MNIFTNKLPYELCLRIYEEYLVLYYKELYKLTISTSFPKNISIENRRALIRSIKYIDDSVYIYKFINNNKYICQLYKYLNPLTTYERTYILNTCNQIYLSKFIQLFIPTYNERILALNRCSPNNIISVYTAITSQNNILFDTNEIVNERLIVIEKCPSKNILELYKILDKPILLSERILILNKCSAGDIYTLFKFLYIQDIIFTQKEITIILNNCHPWYIYDIIKMLLLSNIKLYVDERLIAFNRCDPDYICKLFELFLNISPVNLLYDKNNELSDKNNEIVIALKRCNPRHVINVYKLILNNCLIIQRDIFYKVMDKFLSISLERCCPRHVYDLLKLFVENVTDDLTDNVINITERLIALNKCDSNYIPILYKLLLMNNLEYNVIYNFGELQEERKIAINRCSPKYVPDLYKILLILSQINITENLYLLNKCDPKYIPDLYKLFKLQSNYLKNTQEVTECRKLALNRCDSKYIHVLYGLLDKPILQEETMFVLDKCFPEYIPDLYKLILDSDINFTNDNRMSVFKKCHTLHLPRLLDLFLPNCQEDIVTPDERLFLLENCNPHHVLYIFKRLPNPLPNERLLALEKCHPEYIFDLYKLLSKNHISTEQDIEQNIKQNIKQDIEQDIALNRCDSKHITKLTKLIKVNDD